jgi:hypothetical protein
MSKSTDYTDHAIKDWLTSQRVGELMVHTGPKGDSVVLVKETIKVVNLAQEIRAAVDLLVKSFDAFNVEIVTGKDGPNRIKITRQL